MAALGGDPSAAADNPAGLGLYRRNELSLTLDYQAYRSQGLVSRQFSAGQASWNFSFVNERMTGVVANNVMLSYRRLKNFRREYNALCPDMNSSQTDLMAYKTDGLSEKALQGEEAWEDSEVGWLSKAGYEAYLIDPDTTLENAWMSACAGTVSGRLNVVESGSTDEFSLAWGMNISNQWYVGTELGLRSLVYHKTFSYREAFADGSNYQSTAYFSASGVGVLGKVGVLYRPISALRLGFAFHTPAVMAITTHNSATVSAVTAGAATKVTTDDYRESTGRFTQPLRLVAGVAWQISSKGMVSLQYDYLHDPHKGVQDTHWTRVGAECVLSNNWFFNLGYALQFRSLNNGKWADPIYTLNYNSTRLDTDFANLRRAHFISGGASFRNRFIVVGLAYQCRLSNDYVHFHEFHEPAVPVSSVTHKMLLTIAWRH